MNLVLLGAPGAGKGTQAEKISERYGLVHISTGDIFRENIKKETEIGLLAKSYIDRGELVPDEVTCAIVKDRLRWKDCKNGFILDGFPRNLFQAERLNVFGHIDGVINIEIDPKLLMDRLLGRRVCEKCGANYHISLLGGKTVCEKCGGTLIQRKDDNPETVAARLKVYEAQTAPLTEYYGNKKGILMTFQSTEEPPEALFREIAAALDGKFKK